MSASLYCAQCGALNQPQAATCFACGRSLDEPALPASDARRLIHGRYRLARQLGVGGFGAVYQAEDTTLGNRLVAVKEMSPRGLTAEEAREATQAFQREALLLAGLAHPSLPRIYERFEEDGRWYLVMDFIAGETLEVYLDKRGGNLPVKEALQMALQLAEVLGYLHSRQPPIIFRDLKPSNIIRTPDGQLALVDFGIARFFKPGQSKDTIAFGSPGYAAPEQYGKAQTTPRSDAFSLGALLHQMLTGIDPSEKPFRFAPLTMPRPVGLSALIERMVDMDESQRPASMEIIQRELTALLDAPSTSWRADDLALSGASLSPARVATSAQPVNGPFAQLASASSSSFQPWAAPQPAPKKKGSKGWVIAIVPIAMVLVCPALLYLSSFHSRQVVYDPMPTYSYSYTPVDQPTDTAVPTGSFQATGTPSFSDAPVYSVAWSPDGTRVASGGADSSVAVWDVRTEEKQSLGLINAYGKAYSVAWSPSGRYLAAGTGPVLQIWTFPEMSYDSYDTSAPITSLSWSPDNEHLVLGSDGGPIRITDILSRSITTLAGSTGHFTAVAWSPDGKYIASAVGGVVFVLDSTTGNTVYTSSTVATGFVNSIAWSPDGTRTAFADSTGNVETWDALTGEHVIIYQGDQSAANTVAWSPDGKYLAAGDNADQVQVWASGDTTPVYTYDKHTSPVLSLAWSPDSKRIASGGQDGTVQVWGAFTGANIVTYQQP